MAYSFSLAFSHNLIRLLFSSNISLRICSSSVETAPSNISLCASNSLFFAILLLSEKVSDRIRPPRLRLAAMKVKSRVAIARKTRRDPFLNNHAHSRRENPLQGGCGHSSGVETATNRRYGHSCRSGRHHLTMLLCHFRLFRLPRCGSPLWLMPNLCFLSGKHQQSTLESDLVMPTKNRPEAVNYFSL